MSTQLVNAEKVHALPHNSWNREISVRSIIELTAHPLSVKIYGMPTANEELLASVEQLGILTPVTINVKNEIISGTSRHFAVSEMHKKFPDCGFDKIPTVLFEGTPLEGELLVIESNRQRVKVASQLGREFNERFRIEQEFARLRQEAGVPLKMAEGGDARDKAAKAINLGRTTAERIGKLARKADEGNQKARNLLHQVDNGIISISAAFSAFESNSGPKPADCPVCHTEFPSLTQLYKHGRHDHKMETAEMQKLLGLKKGDHNPAKKDTAKSIINMNNLMIKATAMVKQLEMLLPVKTNEKYHVRKYNDAENVFVKDMQDALHFLGHHKNKVLEGTKPWTDLKGLVHDSDAAIALESLRRTLLQVASELNVYAKQIPIFKSKAKA